MDSKGAGSAKYRIPVITKKLSILQPTKRLETNVLKLVFPNTEVNHQFSKKLLENEGVPEFFKPTLDLSTLMSNI